MAIPLDAACYGQSAPVEPCPTCPEGWRPIEKKHCADCYEGQIERLREELAELKARLERP